MELILLCLFFSCIIIALFWATSVFSDVAGCTFLSCVVGVVALIFFGVLVSKVCLGKPLTIIDPGVYKVAFVYQAGGNVSIGIEKPKKRPYEKTEQLFLYQFPAKDFEGEIRAGAKKLVATKVITGENTLNRYKLE